MNIIAIDPGTAHSGVATLAGGAWRFCAKAPNEALLRQLRGDEDLPMLDLSATVLIEEFKNYGMAVGESSIKTVLWSGRFQEAWESRGGVVELIPRQAVKLHLCGSVRAKDANVRAALLDRLPAGTKRDPGPMFGCTSHAIQAAALAAYWMEVKGER